jgi:PPOX class probable FMN-dependent enzyme
MDEEHKIRDLAELEAVIGSPRPFIKSKILGRLDALMIEFIRKSPLVFVATSDAAGGLDISPKGDPAGFVRVNELGNLLLPERPGNQLAIGFRNILGNARIGLIFVVPNQRETLRIKGRATLRKNPEILQEMQVNRKAALLYTHVEVEECFIHCGKAMVRSNLWKPEPWDIENRSIGGLQLASIVGARTESELEASAARLENAYKNQLYQAPVPAS